MFWPALRYLDIHLPSHTASEPGDDVPSAPSVADAAVAHAAVPQEAKHWAPAALKSLASQDPMHSKGTPMGGGAPTPQWAALQQRLRVADATDTAQGHGRVASRDLMDLTSAGLPCHDQFLAECVAQPILAWVRWRLCILICECLLIVMSVHEQGTNI